MSEALPVGVPGPSLLRGLDHVRPCDGGWIAECPHWGCGGLLHVHADGLEYRLDCDRGCQHEDIVDYLQADTRTDPIAATRPWRALVLAPNPETWQALLERQPVPRTALDPLWAKRFGL